MFQLRLLSHFYFIYSKILISVCPDPEDIKHLVAANEKNPVEFGFDFFVTYRQELRKEKPNEHYKEAGQSWTTPFFFKHPVK